MQANTNAMRMPAVQANLCSLKFFLRRAPYTDQLYRCKSATTWHRVWYRVELLCLICVTNTVEKNLRIEVRHASLFYSVYEETTPTPRFPVFHLPLTVHEWRAAGHPMPVCLRMYTLKTVVYTLSTFVNAITCTARKYCVRLIRSRYMHFSVTWVLP